MQLFKCDRKAIDNFFAAGALGERGGRVCCSKPALADGAYYHLCYPFATKNLAFATVGCGVFLQAGDGHGHLVRQTPFLFARDLA